MDESPQEMPERLEAERAYKGVPCRRCDGKGWLIKTAKECSVCLGSGVQR